MHLLDLPDLVMRRLLSLMGFADLCRVRITCKALDSLVSERLTRLYKLQVRITEEGQSGLVSPSSLMFLEKLGYNIPVTVLQIQNFTENLYTSLQTFANFYGSGIKKLKLQNYFLDCPVQMKFLEALPNLEEFKIGNIDAVGHDRRYTKRCRPCHILQLPAFFKTLKVLKFGKIRVRAVMDTDFWYAMISSATRLNYIRYPRVMFEHNIPVDMERKYECIQELVDSQRTLFSEQEGHWLRYIDFKNINILEDMEFEGFSVIFLIDKVWPLDIKILNMHVAHLSSVSQAFEGEDKTAFNCIASMIDYRSNISILPLDGLEKIVVRDFENVGDNLPDRGWGNLNAIEVHFDAEFVEDEITNLDINENLESMKYLLFHADGRENNVKELNIIFNVNFIIRVPARILSPKDVVRLSALTKLSLVGWNPANKFFPRIWRGLPLLEELLIQNCPSLGNVGLIGEDENNPAFLHLKRLKKLTLALNQHQKLTDRAFRDVFCHVPLRIFNFQSEFKIQSVTKAGILSLLDGIFAKTIERFPFNTWQLEEVSTDEMSQLKSQFKMLIA